LEKWKQTERDTLRTLCRENDILFCALQPELPDVLEQVKRMIADFGEHSVRENLRRVRESVDKLLNQCKQNLETMLILDADKTLSVDDTGSLF
jgi:hypothetical protein